MKNVSNHKVRIEMRGAIFNDVTMSSNQVEPPVAFFLTPTILETAGPCLRQASNGQFFDTADQLTSILKATGANATTAARELISHFNLGLTQVVGLLKQAGYNINQVADAARDAFNASATQVAGALKSTFNASVDSAASALKAAGYSAAQVAAALAQVYNQSVDQTAQILKTVFNATADTASASAESSRLRHPSGSRRAQSDLLANCRPDCQTVEIRIQRLCSGCCGILESSRLRSQPGRFGAEGGLYPDRHANRADSESGIQRMSQRCRRGLA